MAWSRRSFLASIKYSTHCGICASDLHTLRSGWGPTDYPQVVGHEIVGRAVRVGKNVDHVKVGDRVGVGAQSDSCRKCEWCDRGTEELCKNFTGTYNDKFADGSKR
ncbi:MAG: chaperonin 10-like protein [Olpidium bornovanus]|uniref:Chaperonin 10-like protein n=1 Tax=Olpidium bornovanus TaxID=278681 RepID=A0A8H7ZLS2_9FUNG|nr:MAG: chaperonin 10-like protein [Olpidium bornovanus]